MTAAGVLLAVAGWLLGAAATRVHAALPGVVVAGAVLLAVVVTLPPSLSGGPAAPPLGYGNADAALLLAATAGLLVSARHLKWRWRHGLTAAAVLTTVLCALTQSMQATAGCVLLLGWSAVRSRGPAARWQVLSAVLLAAAVTLTFLLGLRLIALPSTTLGTALSQERVEVWSDALDLVAVNPVRGVGAGGFAELSPTAQADADLAWAHSAPLQVAAELGWVGFTLLILLAAWAIVVLRRDAVVAAALLLPATIDYVLDFGWVVLAYSVVLGAGWAGSDGAGKPWLTPPSP